MSSKDIDEILMLADNQIERARREGTPKVTRVAATRDILMHLFENEAQSALAPLINASMDIRVAVEILITTAMSCGYKLAAEDALDIARKAGDKQAKNN